MVLEHLDIFTAEPDNNLLHEREDDEAYVAAVPGKQYGRDDGDTGRDDGDTVLRPAFYPKW